MKWCVQKFIKFWAWLIAHSPWQVRSAMGWMLGILWFDILRIRRRVALENLRRAFPDWSENERVRCARRSLKWLMNTVIDYTLFPFFTDKMVTQYFEIQGAEHWYKAQAEGSGALLLTPHVGRGDLAMAALSRSGYPFHLISKEFKSQWLNEFWFDMRELHGTKFISFHKSSFDILKALRQNHGVIFVNDQYMGPPSGVPVTFFGHPTGTAKGLAVIAERTRAPVLPLYTYALDNGRNVIVFEPPIKFQDLGDKERTIPFMTQVYTDKIEEIVRRYPDQWMWIHKRWKTFA